LQHSPVALPSFHNVVTLAFAQMLAASGLTVVVIIGGLLGAEFAPQPSWATVPLSLAIVSTALTTVPAAMLMRRVGRRSGFMMGALLGVIGGLVAALAVAQRNFALLCGGTMLIGSSAAFTQQYRFAAAESVPLEDCSRAISYVLVGGLGAAILGPQLALSGRHLISGAMYAGSFLSVSALYVGAIVALSRLKPVPAPAVDECRDTGGAPDLGIGPYFRTAVAASAIAFAVMSFVMTAAPISMHMLDHYSVETTTVVIQSHVLAMYLPSLVSGRIVRRFGERLVMIWGALLLASCAAVNLSGHHVMHYWWGLVLLGVGWNLLFVAGTTLLARSVQGPNRHRAQALNEFTVFGSQACASMLAGLAVQQAGWQILNFAVLPLLAVMVVIAARMNGIADVTTPAPAR
jgi:MFS family permease